MNRRNGSALLMILVLMTGVSLLLINLNYRFSLLVQAVVLHEKQIRYTCAAQACMFYAIQLAKHNWNSIGIRTEYDRLSYTDLLWYVTSKEVAHASISFEKSGEGLFITVELLDDEHHKQGAISCKVTAVNKIQREMQVMISEWKER